MTNYLNFRKLKEIPVLISGNHSAHEETIITFGTSKKSKDLQTSKNKKIYLSSITRKKFTSLNARGAVSFLLAQLNNNIQRW